MKKAIIIGAIVLVLVVIAYFVFVRGKVQKQAPVTAPYGIPPAANQSSLTGQITGQLKGLATSFASGLLSGGIKALSNTTNGPEGNQTPQGRQSEDFADSFQAGSADWA